MNDDEFSGSSSATEMPRPAARSSFYRPAGAVDDGALMRARKAALREREALRQHRPLVWPPAAPANAGKPKPKKGWFRRRRRDTAETAGRPMSRPEVYFEPAGPQGPLPAHHNVDARLQASENVRRGPASAFTIEGGTVEPMHPGRQRRKRGSAVAGGRWRRTLLTSVMTIALIVLIVNGLYRLAGKALYDAPAPAPGSGFPVGAASGYASRFGQAYLTWDQASPQSRAEALRVFFPDARNVDFGWDGVGRQSLLGAPVVAGVTARDNTHGVVHLAAYLNPGGWTCMDVAVYAAEGGVAFAITSYVAFIACPPVAAAASSVAPRASEEDRDFAEQVRQTLETFFKAYASSAPEIAQSTTQDSAIFGLGGVVSYVDLVHVDTPVVQDPTADVRQAYTQVRWRLPSGGTLMQTYLLTLRQIGGRWFVQRIEGGIEDADVAPRRGGAPPVLPGAATSPAVAPARATASASSSPTLR